MSRSAIDVAIIGGGPAGAAAALTIARYTDRRCLLVERTDYSAPRIGETVSPALFPLLDYLGASSALPPEAVTACYGSEAAWGDDELARRTSIFSGDGAGWTLDRRRFDAALTAAAETCGVEVRRSAVLRRASRAEGEGWDLQLESIGGTELIAARRIIDASGRRAVFARSAGAGRRVDDELIGIAAFLEAPADTKRPASIIVEAVADGWWYSATLPAGRTVISYMTDSDLVRASGMSAARLFKERLGQTKHIAARATGSEFASVPRVFLARSQKLERCGGPGWLAAGDAAASFDPLSALGIGHALASGIQSARLTHAGLGGSPNPEDAYSTDVARIYADYVDRRGTLYAAEGRWPAHPFWRRRRSGGGEMADEKQ